MATLYFRNINYRPTVQSDDNVINEVEAKHAVWLIENAITECNYFSDEGLSKEDITLIQKFIDSLVYLKSRM